MAGAQSQSVFWVDKTASFEPVHLLSSAPPPAAKAKTEEQDKKAAAAAKRASAKKPAAAGKDVKPDVPGEAWVHRYAPQSMDDMVGNQTLVSISTKLLAF